MAIEVNTQYMTPQTRIFRDRGVNQKTLTSLESGETVALDPDGRASQIQANGPRGQGGNDGLIAAVSDLGEAPDDPDLARELLEANHLFAGTAGATLSLEAATNRVFLQQKIYPDDNDEDWLPRRPMRRRHSRKVSCGRDFPSAGCREGTMEFTMAVVKYDIMHVNLGGQNLFKRAGYGI